MRVKMTTVALLLAALAMALPAAAAARTIKVEEGDSIQSAIDQADPGDTIRIKPGTYAENLLVTKNDITLKGSGPGRTEIVPPASPAPVCGADQGSVQGICGANVDAQMNVLSRVQNLKVKDLSVHGFSGTGILLLGNDGATIVGNVTADNGEYGIAQFGSSNGVYSWNVTPRNHEAGVYVGDSPNANAEVEHNASYDNEGIGIFLRDASVGEAEHNAMWGNCIGMLVLNTGANPHTWEIKDNRVTENNRACAGNPAEGSSPSSGIGIAVASAQDIDIEDNVVLGNRPTGPTDFSGGILLASLGGGLQDIGDIKVANNVAFRNDPFDLMWDGSGQNVRFFGNHCETSTPDGLCAQQHGGDGGHGHGKKHKHRGKHGND